MKTRAFTLVETIVTIAITTLMLLALVHLYINFTTLYVHQETFVATANSAGSSIAAIGSAVLPASHVLASHSFASGTLSSDATTLVLELPAIDASGSIIPNTYDHIGFYLTGTDFYRIIAPNISSSRISSTKKIASLVHTLSFTYNDIDFTKVSNVLVEINTQLATKSGLVETQLHERFYLRNI